MFTPHNGGYGYGWFVYNDKKGRRAYEHSGGYAHFRTWIRRYPNDDTTIAWLGNQAMDDSSVEAFIESVSEAAVGMPWE
jgi:CubicO group peptidase (beta-lactamase class C family)